MNYDYYYSNPPLLEQEVLITSKKMVQPSDFTGNFEVRAKSQDDPLGVVYTFRTYADLEDFWTRNPGTQGAVTKDHINPDHYKQHMVILDKDGDHVDTIQWIEHQQYLPYWRNNMRAFVQAVLIQSDKYFSRLGQKDDETQEMMKALWYVKFATAIMKNGLKPVRVVEIDNILNRKD